MPRRKTATCTVCRSPMWSGPDLAATPCCLPCRRFMTDTEKAAVGVVTGRARRSRIYPATCEQCGRAFIGRSNGVRFCSPQCVGKSQTVRPDEDRRMQRWRRDQRTPGLSTHQRGRLLAKWKRQGRQCFYCPATADTIDHLLPLVRGGSNFEGNLVPCCKTCNSSKGARLVVEWRAALPAGKTVAVAAPRLEQNRPRGRRLVLIAERTCAVCGRLFAGARKRHCSAACMVEHNRRVNRDRHRRMAGLPVDGGPTTKWVVLPGKRRAGPRRRATSVAGSQLSIVG